MKSKTPIHMFLSVAVVCGVLVVAVTASAQNMATFSPADTEGPQGVSVKQGGVPVGVALDETIAPEALQQILSQQQTVVPETSTLDLPVASSYTLGINDVIDVVVARHPEVSGQFNINGEGKIQYQFVGDIAVVGLTKDQAKEQIVKELGKYIIAPEVTIKIVGYNSKAVYVIGEVGQPGKIYMRGDTITIQEALVAAGLPLLSAKSAKSRLITPSETGKVKQKNVNVQRLLYEGDLRENLVMKPGDILYVPATILAKVMRVLQPVAAPIGTAAGTGRTVMTGF